VLLQVRFTHPPRWQGRGSGRGRCRDPVRPRRGSPVTQYAPAETDHSPNSSFGRPRYAHATGRAPVPSPSRARQHFPPRRRARAPSWACWTTVWSLRRALRAALSPGASSGTQVRWLGLPFAPGEAFKVSRRSRRPRNGGAY